MKKLVDQPKPPFPLYRKKSDGTFDHVLTVPGDQIWVCGECGSLHNKWVAGKEGDADQEKRAAECCLQKRCVICQEPAQPYYTDQKCTSCHDQANRDEREAKAIEVTDLATLSDDPIYSHERDQYWQNVSEFEDWVRDRLDDQAKGWVSEDEGEMPVWLYPCSVHPFGPLDADDVVQHRLDESHEDARDSLDMDGLQTLLDHWVSQQSIQNWSPDYNRKIRASLLVPELVEVEKDPKESA